MAADVPPPGQHGPIEEEEFMHDNTFSILSRRTPHQCVDTERCRDYLHLEYSALGIFASTPFRYGLEKHLAKLGHDVREILHLRY